MPAGAATEVNDVESVNITEQARKMPFLQHDEADCPHRRNIIAPRS